MFVKLLHTLILIISLGTVNIVDTYTIHSIDNVINGYDLTYRDVFGDSLYGEGKTNLIENGDFSLDNNIDGKPDNWNCWDLPSGYEYLEGKFKLITIENNGSQQGLQSFYTYINHKYYFSLDIDSINITLNNRFKPIVNDITLFSINSEGKYSNIITATKDYQYNPILRIYNYDNVNGDYVVIDNVILYDLTSIFGSGNEPTLEKFEEMLSYYETYHDYADISWSFNILGIEYLILFSSGLLLWYLFLKSIKKGFRL